jgi:hypothetical protein
MPPLTWEEFVDGDSPVYAAKGYRHFDEPLSAQKAFALVSQSEDKLAKHAFLPFMSFEKKQRRYGRRFKGFGTRARLKVRPLKYASHRDGYIYAAYARRLGKVYEQWVVDNHLQDNVIAYRKTGKNNIQLAQEAFKEITRLSPCKAFALDLKSFFETIPHHTLLTNWKLLRGGALPAAEYKIYRSLTKYATCEKAQVIEALVKLGKYQEIPKGKPIRLADIEIYREHIAVMKNPNSFGVPQGSAMSALVSNIAMMKFDLAMKARFESQLQGAYRRYSDDILVITPSSSAVDVEQEIGTILLKEVGDSLTINSEKTVKCEFIKDGDLISTKTDLGHGYHATLDYLGFCFDGKRTLLRSSTLSRYWRRLKWKVQTEIGRHQRYVDERVKKGNPNIRLREILRKFTAQNFRKAPNAIRYALVASHIMDEKAIRKQIAKHRKFIKQNLSKREK